MSLASSHLDRADAPLFVDGLGERRVAADATTGELLQILRIRAELTAVPSLEFALRERTARLMNFRHAYYARVRRVDRAPGGGLAIVSDHVEGTRLSDLLRVSHQRGLQLNTNAAVCLIRQLVHAVALLHENVRDASHGLLAPERLVVTPHARLVVVEHVMGSAIEQLQFARERLWQEFRLAIPSSAGAVRFDHRSDVNGIGITALSLVLGRPIAAEEFPHAIPQLLMQARERSPMGEERPLSNGFRNWLGRTLQLDVRRAFASAPEALAALEETLASDSSYAAAPVALETFLAEYTAALTGAAAPATMPTLSIVPPPAPAASRSFRPPAVNGAVALAAAPVPVAPAQRMPSPQGGSHVAVEQAPRPSETPEPAQPVPTLAELIAVDDLRAAADAAGAVTTERVGPLEDSTRSPERTGELSFLALDNSLAKMRESSEPVAVDLEVEESAQPMPAPAAGGGARRSRARLIAVAVVLAAALGGGAYASRFVGRSAPPAEGTLAVQSSPAGVEVFVDGVSRGVTPAKIALPPGSHILELRGRGVPRVIPLQITSGAQVSQYLEFADTPTTGMLVVHSQPAGANVTVDGVARGVTPLTVEGLSSGDHEVVLQSATGSSKHTVKVLAGTTASLVAPVIPATPVSDGPVSGWIAVKAPFVIEIHEDGNLIGTTESDRLMLAAGRHVLEFVNQAVGYRQSRTVQVVPGKVSAMTIELPQGTVNLNASPWAEVWLDGRRIGETPIGNLAVPIGPHEIVFRHPEFGEKKHAVSVTTAAPVRLSVSMK
jgi:PEGA domain